MADIELNPEFVRALALMEAGKRHLFVTGRAGTGKSTLLSHYCATTEREAVVLAPTGVAALNIGGQTVHRFFGFGLDVTPEKVRKQRRAPRRPELYERLQTIVIDEASMLRADLLDCVDAFLRKHGPERRVPFGGVQMVFVGDLYQLPPVVPPGEREIFRTLYDTPYFFSAEALEDTEMEIVELEKVYRQKDAEFVALLNRVRNNSVDPGDLARLNERVRPAFEPRSDEFYVVLTTTNRNADRINAEKLARLPAVGKSQHFAPVLGQQFVERGRNDGIGHVGAVDDFLHGIADAAAPIPTRLALFQLVGVLLVGFTLPDTNGYFTITRRFRLGDLTATPAQNMRCSILRQQIVVHAEVGLAGIPYGFLQLSVSLLTNVVVLSAFATQRDFQGFRSRIVIIGAFPIEHDNVRTVLMNQKCPFERPQEGMVSAWRFVGACRFRFSEDDAGCRERFSEKRLCKLRDRLLVPLVFAGRNGCTGGDTAEGVLPPAITQPLLEAPDQHAHFHSPGAPGIDALRPAR